MSLKASIIGGLLLVIPFNPAALFKDSCLSTNFFGNYRDGQSMYSVIAIPNADTSPECTTLRESQPMMAHYTAIPSEGRQLVWLEEKAVDEKLKLRVLPEDNLNVLMSGLLALEQSQQEVMSISKDRGGYSALEVHYRSATAALVSVTAESARNIDTLLPPFWKSTILPTTPVFYRPVPPSATKRVSEILAALEFSPIVSSVVNNISLPQIKKDIRFLTGEDKNSGIVSRHSFSEGALTAANWLKANIEETGAKCRLSPFLRGFAPNVIWFVQR